MICRVLALHIRKMDENTVGNRGRVRWKRGKSGEENKVNGFKIHVETRDKTSIVTTSMAAKLRCCILRPGDPDGLVRAGLAPEKSLVRDFHLHEEEADGRFQRFREVYRVSVVQSPFLVRFGELRDPELGVEALHRAADAGVDREDGAEAVVLAV
jgi:hypothetical protein